MLCWILVALLAVIAWIFWQQLLKWKAWKFQIRTWIEDYQQWVAKNCTCNAPGPPPPPAPPSWPNGGW